MQIKKCSQLNKMKTFQLTMNKTISKIKFNVFIYFVINKLDENFLVIVKLILENKKNSLNIKTQQLNTFKLFLACRFAKVTFFE